MPSRYPALASMPVIVIMGLCLQTLKQQLKGWEQNSPSHMQVVQQQHPFSMQLDTDTKMPQLPGFDHERQQLANAMAGQTPCCFSTPCPVHL